MKILVRVVDTTNNEIIGYEWTNERGCWRNKLTNPKYTEDLRWGNQLLNLEYEGTLITNIYSCEYARDLWTGAYDKDGKEVFDNDELDGVWESCHVTYCERCKSWQVTMNDDDYCFNCNSDGNWQYDFINAPEEIIVKGRWNK